MSMDFLKAGNPFVGECRPLDGTIGNSIPGGEALALTGTANYGSAKARALSLPPSLWL